MYVAFQDLSRVASSSDGDRYVIGFSFWY